MLMGIDSVKFTQFIVEASQNFSISETKTFELESGNVILSHIVGEFEYFIPF